jgi:ABC-type Mn2+/Zn2+ transport system ATPase subunit
MNSDRRLLLNVTKVGFRFASTSRLRISYVPKIELHPGELLAVMGPNGCGKTTLSRAICGFSAHHTGSIECSRVPSPLLVWQTKELFPTTVAQNLYLVGGKKVEVDSMLERFELSGSRNRDVYELSGGEQQRLSLARALVAAKNRRLVIFDEPDQNLDPEAVSLVAKVISELNNTGSRGIVVVTHSFQLLCALGGLHNCKVAVYEKLPSHSFDLTQKPLDLSQMAVEIFALHNAIKFQDFMDLPTSPYGAYLLGYENVFGIPHRTTDMSLYDLYSLDQAPGSSSYDLVLIPARALSIFDSQPNDQEDWAYVKAIGFAERGVGGEFSRLYSADLGSRNLPVLVAASTEENLPNAGYVFINQRNIIRRNSAGGLLGDQVRSEVTNLMLGLR